MRPGFLTNLHGFLRANFFAGLFIAVPFTITLAALIWMWTKINGPLAAFFNMAAGPEEMPWSSIVAAIETSKYDQLIVPMIGLALLLFAVLVLGIVTRSIIGRTLLRILEGIVGRVPLVGMLYMSLKQLGEAFLSSDGSSKFQSAVAVQFPYKGCWAIGFVTGKAQSIMRGAALIQGKSNSDILTVFVPTTPLPTAGFLMMVPKDDTIQLDMSVQDALRLVVSGGMVGPSESQKSKLPQGAVTRVIGREIDQLGLGSGRQTNAAEP